MKNIFVLLSFIFSVLAIQAPDNKGTEFIVGFLPNYVPGELSVFLSAEQQTTVLIQGPGLGFSTSITVNAGQTIKVPLSSNFELSYGLEQKALSLKSTDTTKEFTVIGFNRFSATTDAYLALPVNVLDTEYVLVSFNGLNPSYPSSAAVIATEDGTTVTIRAAQKLNVGSSALNQNSQTFSLNKYQTLYMTSDTDVTGSTISSNKPIGVIAGSRCSNVLVTDVACDMLLEWIAPVNTWSNEFFTVPLATRTAGDVIRVVTNQDANQITINGVVVATINRYQYYQVVKTTANRIQTSKPALVMQYSRGSSADGVTSDPFQMWVPPAAQYSANYFITTLTGFSNWVNLVIESGQQSGLSIDGTSVPTTGWVAVPSTNYVWKQIQVSAGFHSVFHTSPIVPFGVFVYGWASYDSYGYPGGMRLAPLQDPCTETTTIAGDGIDNDCDGRIDEELRNNVDDDGDGRVDEDLAQAVQSCCDVSQIAPFFTGTATSTTIQCDQSVPAVPTISATVDCPEPTTSVLTPTITTTAGNCVDKRTITRKWVASDECGRSNVLTQTINVIDTVPPTVDAPANKVVECGQTTFGDSATASDSCAGTLTATFSDNTGGNSCSSTITRTWSAVDHCGNTGSDSQVITVVDTTAPTSVASDFCVFPPNGLYKCFDVSEPNYIFASDACNNDITVTFNNDCINSDTEESSGCVYNAGSSQVCVKATTDHVSDAHYTFSFTLTDSCGNSAVQPVQVTVPNSAANAQSCLAPDTCLNDCDDAQCPPTTFDLFVGDIQVGYLFVRNKLNWEVSFEFVTFEGSVPDRGWWMTGLVASIGDKRIVKDFTFGNYQSRWFEVLDAFPLRDVPCGAEIQFFAAVQVTNDKRNVNGQKFTVYPNTESASKRSFQLPSDIDNYKIPYTLCCECTSRTQTQNDFGNICNLQRTSENARIREIACYTYDFWTWSESWCFPNGLTVGCEAGNSVTWTSPSSLQNYLADETSPHVLAQDYVDPPRGTVGYLAAETAALALNMKLDECDADWGSTCAHLRDLSVCKHPNSEDRTQCQPFWGQTVGQIFDLANSVVGGCSQGNVEQLFECVRYINREFVDGKRFWEAGDFLAYATCPQAS